MHYVLLYVEFVKIKFMGIAENRKAFFMAATTQAVSYGAEIMLIWVLLNQFRTINGWNAYEVMLLYALNLGSYAIAAFFLFNTCTNLSTMIKKGTFDEVLTKPLNSFLYLISRDTNNGYFSHFTLALVIMAICFHHLGIHLNGFDLMFLLLVLASGAAIQAAGFIFTSVPAFWVVEIGGLRNILFQQLRSFIRYPISVYHKAIQVLLTLIMPYAFINFYPAQYFLHKDDFLMFHPWFQYASPVVGLLLLLAAYGFWNVAINRYQSTGS